MGLLILFAANSGQQRVPRLLQEGLTSDLCTPSATTQVALGTRTRGQAE